MIVLMLLFWVVSIFFNDIEDTLQYRCKDSIFDWINKKSWWSWYMKDPDDTWKRKYVWLPGGRDGDVRVGRQMWLGFIVKPSFVLDGWHGAKIIRQGFQYLTVFCGFMVGYLLVPLTPIWIVFVSGLVSFAILNYYSHNVWFFDGMMLKEWWIERGKEEKIFKLLDKL